MTDYWHSLTNVTSAAFGHWQFLLAMFVVSLLGEGGFPFPLVMTSVLLLVGVHMANGEVLGSVAVLSAGLAGTVTGASALHLSGRLMGRSVLDRRPGWLKVKQAWFAHAERLVAGAGVMTIAHARLVPALALPTSLITGITRMDWRRFVAGVVLSEFLWTAPFVLCGFLTGSLVAGAGSVFTLVPIALFSIAGAFLLAKAMRLLLVRRLSVAK